MRLRLALAALFFAAAVFAAERPKAPAGYHWKDFEENSCEIQVPDGWFESKRTAGVTKVVLISPVKIPDGHGIDTGFTMNTVKCRSQENWKHAMEQAGKMMSDARDAIENPVESSIQNKDDMVVMIVEGERFIADSPHPEKKYHVRTIVRAFPKAATVFLYSFGAPVDQWEEAWKKGKTMLNPILFSLPP